MKATWELNFNAQTSSNLLTSRVVSQAISPSRREHPSQRDREEGCGLSLSAKGVRPGAPIYGASTDGKTNFYGSPHVPSSDRVLVEWCNSEDRRT